MSDELDVYKRQIQRHVVQILAYRDLNDMPLDLPNVSRAINLSLIHI